MYFWNSSVFSLHSPEDDADVGALREKNVTVTPLQFDMTNYAVMREWEQREWRV